MAKMRTAITAQALLIKKHKKKSCKQPQSLQRGSKKLPPLAQRQEAASGSSCSKLQEAPRRISIATGHVLDNLLSDFKSIRSFLQPSLQWCVCRGTLLAAMWDHRRFPCDGDVDVAIFVDNEETWWASQFGLW